jgi:hypothetical protein
MRKAWQAGAVVTLLLSALSAVPAKAVSSNPTPTCVDSTCTITFSFTGDYYQWSAPATGNYVLEAWGAQGGNAQYNGTINLYGGAGGYAKGTYAATAGQTFYIYVGGQGTSSTDSLSDSLPGGFNGGGNGFNSNLTSMRGAGGGGAADIRIGGNALSNRIIVAGGGGGNTYDTSYGTNTAGVGGGINGTAGLSSHPSLLTTYGGKGGTSSVGGAKGTNCTATYYGTSGSSGLGGNGESNPNRASAGGGGGYFGGGGSGCGFAGGGGSGYVGSLTSTTLTAGDATMTNPAGGTMTGRTGNGFVRITYAYVAPTISLTSAGNATSASKGIGIVLTAAISSSGSVTFYANQKRIAGCINLAASSGNKTCTWKPTGLRGNQIYATLSQSGSVVATSSTLSIAGTKRVGTR